MRNLLLFPFRTYFTPATAVSPAVFLVVRMEPKRKVNN
ncbi:hypothetical protein FHS42_004217 [Streptomyces zagrosensis]|uniref:Uncharacterized protein n=1 Tax=Streptomyces zagrosensis TaxID=1042984 RepID=A0A7W9QCA1_9ACTN|nr:hypothetical protein [Streptomyces zagrosensis]